VAAPLADMENPRAIDRQAGNDWTYASMDLTPQPPGRVKHFILHFLHVEPDLFVVAAEVALNEPATAETAWRFPAGTTRNTAWEDWRLQLPKAGLTARLLASPKNHERLRPAVSGDHPGQAAGLATVWVGSGTTNKTSEFWHLAALVPHEGAARRALAFKLLESDTAIGMRVHRDGLPTLLALRRRGTSGEADLTGLRFPGPVAVDVFQPRTK
jgi:hypothetical protein